MTVTTGSHPAAFSPDLSVDDPDAAYWLTHVVLRLRRELAWRRQQRRDVSERDANRLVESLDRVRHFEAKKRFFAEDPTAAYLTASIAQPAPLRNDEPLRGSFGWLARELQLDDVSTFVLALSLLTAFDSAAHPVIAACLNDASRARPTLELAQRLWDRPEDVLQLADPTHALWQLSILQTESPTCGALEWDTALVVAPSVAARLLSPRAAPPGAFSLVTPDAMRGSLRASDVELVRARVASERSRGLCIVPIVGRRGAPFEEAVAELTGATGARVFALKIDRGALLDAESLGWLFALGWLLGDGVFVSSNLPDSEPERERLRNALSAARETPLIVFVAVRDRAELAGFPDNVMMPAVTLAPSSYEERAELWRTALRRHRDLEPAIPECARRFRYEPETIRTIANMLNRLGREVTSADLASACRAEIAVDCGDLAELVPSRFDADELVLAAAQTLQLEEIARAMTALTRVHYELGAARAWNESGIAVLFSGPPGTGKTMAAEVLASRLDLPMYRIDLSQVVDKYVGVTEKNLKRLFDAADVADILLFFDEADALFGRRSEVKDAHDRYANNQIAYLLGRMERFKGLAVLATNRRGDLDEAFLRRLRFIVEFPLPDADERERIWRRVMPPNVDATSLDWVFLAQQFPLAGGHIRSAAFNACLESAGCGDAELTMERVVVAVKREYDKLKRSVALSQFGPYAALVETVAP